MRVWLGLVALWVSGVALGAPTPGERMDYGPVLASSLRAAPAKAGEKRVVLAYKGLNIKLGDGAAVCFDTELMRYAAGWTGGWLDLKKTHMTTSKGEVCPAIGGKVAFTTAMGPGVSYHGSLADPRTNPNFPHRGPLPKEQAHYSGMYLDGDRVAIAYMAGGGKVLETPGVVRVGDQTFFTRTMRVERTTEPLTFVLADGAEGLSAEVVKGPDGAKIEKQQGGLRLVLPAVAGEAVFAVVMGTGDMAAAAKGFALRDPAELTHGGPGRWKEVVETRGALAVNPRDPKAAYVVDTLTLPELNPWSSWMRVSGVDFFPDGKSAAVTTWNGDVWVVSGIDESLSQLAWKRYATGLYEPLGVKIVGGKVYALGRDQITRLTDLDGDGEADFYENFNNDGLTGDWYHLFKFDLDTDSAGNFYYSVVGAWAPTDLFVGLSTICKVSADGSKLEYIGRGLRAPNGMAVGPGREIVVGDNQGHWMPASKINYIPAGKRDGFYGFPYDPRIEKTFDVKKFYPHGIPKTFDPPLCWIPYALDTSSGGQAFVPAGEKWGPFGGRIVHTSYGKAALFLVMDEVKGGVAQGGCGGFRWRLSRGSCGPGSTRETGNFTWRACAGGRVGGRRTGACSGCGTRASRRTRRWGCT
jgi:glucose/arabinose dehydrogenase